MKLLYRFSFLFFIILTIETIRSFCILYEPEKRLYIRSLLFINILRVSIFYIILIDNPKIYFTHYNLFKFERIVEMRITSYKLLVIWYLLNLRHTYGTR